MLRETKGSLGYDRHARAAAGPTRGTRTTGDGRLFNEVSDINSDVENRISESYLAPHANVFQDESQI